jgi:hypothetical protein
MSSSALVAELVAGELARAIGLAVPEIVLAQLDPELARLEPDPEIQELIRWSAGLNLALGYLPGALGFDPLVDSPEPGLAPPASCGSTRSWPTWTAPCATRICWCGTT